MGMLIKRKSVEKEAALRRPEEKPAKGGRRKVRFAPVILSECGGVRYLHFGTEWVQGAMRIRDPYRLELAYARQMMAWMLFGRQPGHIVQLGLGAGALTRFCYRYFPQARVTAVELNEEVTAVCRSMFALPPEDGRLAVAEMDAMDFVAEAPSGSVSVIQADLFDATDLGPVLDMPAFYAACARSLEEEGVLAVNLFGQHESYPRNYEAIAAAFPCVLTLPACREGNVVVLAMKKRPVPEQEALRERARAIRRETGLALLRWADGLYRALSAASEPGQG
ncbi:MAG: methyltransferase domain-containing protein [Alistipes senegalensis]|nr:methyltransferase domain-containing protein [Alistipes senegalensis]